VCTGDEVEKADEGMKVHVHSSKGARIEQSTDEVNRWRRVKNIECALSLAQAPKE
jgi:hypothetical protein